MRTATETERHIESELEKVYEIEKTIKSNTFNRDVDSECLTKGGRK